MQHQSPVVRCPELYNIFNSITFSTPEFISCFIYHEIISIHWWSTKSRIWDRLSAQWNVAAFPSLWSQVQKRTINMFGLRGSTQFYFKGKSWIERGWWDLRVFQKVCCSTYLVHSLNTTTINNTVFHFYHLFSIHVWYWSAPSPLFHSFNKPEAFLLYEFIYSNFNLMPRTTCDKIGTTVGNTRLTLKETIIKFSHT